MSDWTDTQAALEYGAGILQGEPTRHGGRFHDDVLMSMLRRERAPAG